MSKHRTAWRAVIAATVTGLVASSSLVLATPAHARVIRTSDEVLTDAVSTPTLKWWACGDSLQCTTVNLPLDYRYPKGKKIEVGLVKSLARKPASKIGSLFLNPGGPSGSAASMVGSGVLQSLLPASVVNSFDLIGVDPRGVGVSQQLQCLPISQQYSVMKPFNAMAFPYTSAEQKSWMTASAAIAKGCATTGKALAGHVSTAEVARDMEVLRRAVGDKQLNYFGFSYGTYLGQVYANMFPDRVRTMILDGVLDPTTWAGNRSNSSIPMAVRIKSAQGAYTALTTIMTLCDKAGAAKCALAGNAMQRYTKVANTLKVKPLVTKNPDGSTSTLTYANFVGMTQGILMDNSGLAPDMLTMIVANVEQALNPATPSSVKAAATAKVAQKLAELSRQKFYGFQYDNGFDIYSAVMCTDSVNSSPISSYPAFAAAADKQTPFFGALRTWQASQCASNIWTVKDATAYTGPFNRTTATGVLVVGNYFDPATNYGNATRVSQLLPGARLLTSNSFGHTAFGTSDCINNAMATYLVTKALPKAGIVCQPRVAPFSQSSSDAASTQKLALPGIAPVLPVH